MKYAFNVLAALLLTSGAVRLAAADAVPQTMPVRAAGLREQMRALQFEQQAMAQREHRASPAQASEPQTQDGNADPASAQVPDDASKNGRMSPEERRALRRQIDEAGHEIYSPSH